MPLVASLPDQGTRRLISPALMPVPATNPRRGAVTVGPTVSSTIVSVLTADQLPATSFHLTRTVRVPLVPASVHGWLAA